MLFLTSLLCLLQSTVIHNANLKHFTDKLPTKQNTLSAMYICHSLFYPIAILQGVNPSCNPNIFSHSTTSITHPPVSTQYPQTPHTRYKQTYMYIHAHTCTYMHTCTSVFSFLPIPPCYHHENKQNTNNFNHYIFPIFPQHRQIAGKIVIIVSVIVWVTFSTCNSTSSFLCSLCEDTRNET